MIRRYMNLVVLTLTLTMLLAGCGTTKTTTRIVYQPVRLTPELLRPCPVSEPPIPEAYIQATVQDRLLMLEQYSYRLIGDLRMCDADKTAAREEQSKILKLYQPEP